MMAWVTTRLEDHRWPSEPWAAKHWVLLGGLLPNRALRGMNGVPFKNRPGRYQPGTARATRFTDAPCRIPPTYPASRARQAVPEPASSWLHPEPCLYRTEAPSTNKSHRLTWPLPGSDRMGRHQYPPLIAGDPASGMRSRPTCGALGARACRLFAGA